MPDEKSTPHLYYFLVFCCMLWDCIEFLSRSVRHADHDHPGAWQIADSPAQDQNF